VPSKQERAALVAAARTRGRIAQYVFGPDAERRRLLTAPIYKAPPPTPAERFADAAGVDLTDWQKAILNGAVNQRAE
jgi:hypothetical protein